MFFIDTYNINLIAIIIIPTVAAKITSIALQTSTIIRII